MAYYFLFPHKDTTIYSHPNRDKLNAGHDEILELVQEKSNTASNRYYSSRILIQFKDSEIEDVIKNKIKENTYSASLQLFSTEHRNLETQDTLNVYLVSQSWNEGSGRYSNLPTSSNGCSWLYTTDSSDKTAWVTSSSDLALNTDGNGSWEVDGGGTWYSQYVATQSFDNASDLDINIDVTQLMSIISSSIFANNVDSILAANISDGYVNNGFIIKRGPEVEAEPSSSKGELKYFSVDTHTIFPPRLAFKWDDSIHNKQSSAKTSGELNVSLYRNKLEYKNTEEALFRIHVRDKYPTRQFASSSNFLNVGYFTTSSFYSVRDAATEDILIPFDHCTKLSADNEGIYFKMHMNGLQPERYYRLLFKHINDDGTIIYDDDFFFKIVR